jgi:hypothetical protein
MHKIQIASPTFTNATGSVDFSGHEYFSTTSGNVTEDIILQYLKLHSRRKPIGVNPQWFRLGVTSMADQRDLKLLNRVNLLTLR